MIKILKEGQLPKRTKSIYKITCKYCGCEFECEAKDFYRLERCLFGKAEIYCPTCNELLTVNLADVKVRDEEIILEEKQFL